MRKSFNDFKGLYKLSKTICFKLIPQGDTLKNIQDYIAEDEHRAESYKKVKAYIDEFHKQFIEDVLTQFRFDVDDLQQLADLLQKQQDDKGEKAVEALQAKLMKQVAKSFEKDETFKKLFKKEIITELLPLFAVANNAPQDIKDAIAEFANFTTYFVGFHENRRNMYSPEAQITAIGNRIVNQNFPKHLDNMMVFAKVAAVPELRGPIAELYKEVESYLNVAEIAEIFTLDNFNFALSQSQIDVYNLVIGGKFDSDSGQKSEKKIKGLNEIVNLYNQQHQGEKLPRFKMLYKQILSDREAVSWLPEKFETANELLAAVKDYYEQAQTDFAELKRVLAGLGEYGLGGIFLTNNLGLTNVSQKLYGRYDFIERAVVEDIKKYMTRKRKETDDDFDDRARDEYKKRKSLSVAYVNNCLSATDKPFKVETYFMALGKISQKEEDAKDLFSALEERWQAVRDDLAKEYPQDKNLAQDESLVERVKALLDAVKSISSFIQPLFGTGKEAGRDQRFYSDIQPIWESLAKFSALYDMVRNFLTKKPYSDSKFKINFGNATLLNGWDKNKEMENTSVLLRKDGKYFLAIMNRKFNKSFVAPPTDDSDFFDKMDYKLLPGPNKMLPKVFFAKSNIDFFNPSDEILSIYERGSFKKGDGFSLADCHKLIDFYKASIERHEDWSKFDFNFSDTETYEDISGFYAEVEAQGYKVSFSNVSAAYVDKLVQEGKLFLFQIYRKDFSPFSKGRPSLETIYWRMLFDERNLADVVYKLNGEAEVFFRKKSLNYPKPTHPAGVPIANKNPLNKKRQSCFDYDITKDRRYTLDQFTFHVPLTFNFKSRGADNINAEVREYLKNTDEDVHIIGIDRGERHLLYLSVINQRGQIVHQETLNVIRQHKDDDMEKEVVAETDYHDLLDRKEKERNDARVNWKSIEGIKDIKAGYMSQVVHRVVSLMMRYKAFVVLEDLNFGFKRGRQKVEKQVYQNFEKALINKLNYLVDKSVADAHAPAGTLAALQLASKFESFAKLGKQSGFLFYVPAWETSKIDPVTGFVNLLYTRYESVDKSRNLVAKFDDIRFNESKGWFEFDIDYDKFGSKATGTQTKWTLCSCGTRIETKRDPEQNNNFVSKEVDLTQAFRGFFALNGIELSGNIKKAIADNVDAQFHRDFCRLLSLLLQMRNSVTGTEIDYMISPVAGPDGSCFDSRNAAEDLPQNADANGAYNIARKGLWVLRALRDADDVRKADLKIDNKTWLAFAQQKPYLAD